MTAFEDLFRLRAFVCIVECGSISAGARRLRISQPTLSRHLRALEDSCGATLLRRDTHQMCVTEAGQRVLTDARALLTQAEDADQRLREDRTALSGHLRLFATLDWGQFVVTRMVSSFLQKNPRVTASLALTNRPLHMIGEGCDVGIQLGKITGESVIARSAGKITLHLAASPALIKSRPTVKQPSDLKSWPWVVISGVHFFSANEINLFSARDEQTFRISPVLVTEGATSIREAARAGLGIALLPDWMVREDIRSRRLVRVLPQWKAKDLPIHVVYARQRLLPLRVSAFIDFAVGYMESELKRGPASP